LFEDTPPLLVSSASGCIIRTNQGAIIDAISSWWCKSLGHRHPNILHAIHQQLEKFEHIIAANCTHDALAKFGSELAAITKKQHVYFASDGSSAVEIALKMALHVQQLTNPGSNKTTVLALENAYHGETFATLAVSDLGLYKAPYKNHGLNAYFIKNIPYINTIEEDKFIDLNFDLDSIEDNIFAFVFEPVVQGAAGMKMYSPKFLNKLVSWARERNIIIIADEIMTGVGRTGTWLASEHANIEPDMICLSKGLSAGAIPIGTVSIDHKIYDYFYHLDENPKKLFLHSHTHSANSLAVAVALATIETIKNDNLLQNSYQLGRYMLQTMQNLSEELPFITNVRGGLGAWVAADLLGFDNIKMREFTQNMLKAGVLIRPIENTFYWLLPLIANKAIIDQIVARTKKVLSLT
jgi:adenosylmethionine-8-amino-7-oxononanoate aminotransferase